MNISEILDTLISAQDIKFRDFSSKLVPETDYPLIGVKLPKLKEIAKTLAKNPNFAITYIKSKHSYYEEYMISALTIGYLNVEFSVVVELINYFLPYINTWGICDSFVANLKVFKKNKQKVFELVKVWLKSENTYTVRVGVVTLLDYFVKDENIIEIFELLKDVNKDNYYINMAIAWFYSVALVYHYDETVELLEKKCLNKFIHNKTISKAIDSFRITDEKKIFIKSLKI